MSPVKEPPADPPDPDPGDRLAEAEALLAPDPIIQAAYQAVIGVFDSVAAQLPDLIQAQAPPGTTIPKFTADIIEGLAAQLRRALKVGPDDPAGPK